MNIKLMVSVFLVCGFFSSVTFGNTKISYKNNSGHAECQTLKVFYGGQPVSGNPYNSAVILTNGQTTDLGDTFKSFSFETLGTAYCSSGTVGLTIFMPPQCTYAGTNYAGFTPPDTIPLILSSNGELTCGQ